MFDADDIGVALFGRDERRTLVSLAVTLAISVAFLAVGQMDVLARPGGTVASEHFTGSVAVYLVGAVVAVATAYWNDGVVTSAGATFLPGLAWEYQLFAARSSMDPVSALVAAAGIPFLLTLVVGVPGYVVGRLLSNRPSTDGDDALLAVMIGRDGRLARRVLAASVAIAFLWTGALALGGPDVLTWLYPAGSVNGLPGVLATVAWVGLPVYAAYRGGGVLVCWAALAVPVVTAGSVDLLLYGRGGLYHAVTVGGFGGIVVSLALGTVGFLVGRTVGRTGVRVSNDAPG